jgi:hypothetical protein
LTLALGCLEGRVALEVLAQRLPNLRMVPDQIIEYPLNFTFRGPEKRIMEWDVVA